MPDAQERKPFINWAAIGPVMLVLTTAGGMALGFGQVLANQEAQSKEIAAANARIDKLYDLLIYPSVGQRQQ